MEIRKLTKYEMNSALPLVWRVFKKPKTEERK